MKQTLLNSALANMTGALALTIMLGAGVAMADTNNAKQGAGNIAAQDFLNDNLSGNLSGNTYKTRTDNDGADVDLNHVANGSLNHNLSGNTVESRNDNDGFDIDVKANNVGNDASHDDNDGIDADVFAYDVLNDKSTKLSYNDVRFKKDNSVSIENVAMLVNQQTLLGAAALVNMSTYSGDIETGSVMYGHNTNKMFAGNKTTSINTGAGSVALSASAIQANGNFSLGGH